MKITISGINLEDGTVIERVFDNVTDYTLSVIKQTDFMDKKNRKLGFRIEGLTTSHSSMYPRDLLKEDRQGLEDLISNIK